MLAILGASASIPCEPLALPKGRMIIFLENSLLYNKAAASLVGA